MDPGLPELFPLQLSRRPGLWHMMSLLLNLTQASRQGAGRLPSLYPKSEVASQTATFTDCSLQHPPSPSVSDGNPVLQMKMPRLRT